MKYEVENLDALFRRINISEIKNRLADWGKYNNEILIQKSYNSARSRIRPDFSVGEEQHIYEQAIISRTRNYTSDEINMRYRNMHQKIYDDNDAISSYGRYILITDFADRVLRTIGGLPVFKIGNIFEWRDAYLILGQDIFTTAWFAKKDFENNAPDRRKRRQFKWSPILKSDDVILNSIIGGGLAENHFHLHGSTQNFALTWGCMMNHPDKINKFWNENELRYLLNEKYTFNVSASDVSEKLMCYYAVIIRALLTMCNRGMVCHLVLKKIMEQVFNLPEYAVASRACGLIESLRIKNDIGFRQVDGSFECLDYSISSKYYDVDEDSPFRFLTGERHFLYESFYNCFSNEWEPYAKELFYMYLVVKSNIRGELVQINEVLGFRNFARHQDRKDLMYDKLPEYEAEALRLSVAAPILENNVEILEARISPKTTAGAIRNNIKKFDRNIDFALYGKEWNRMEKPRFEYDNNRKRKAKYFYVTHFIKHTIWEDNYSEFTYKIHPRNYTVRKTIKRQAYALKELLRKSKTPRIFGIDACTHEIGCRPETFATEFRYLFDCPYRQEVMKNAGNNSHWGCTYHAGEDFLDIADGIRAIDEALIYIGLTRGDRIGHALALGIDPLKYYDKKKYSVVMCGQDLLDNFIWIIYRASSLGIQISNRVYDILKLKARRLFVSIYGEELRRYGYDENIEDYFQLYFYSWLLRGDNPKIYSYGRYYRQKDRMINDGYDNYLEMKNIEAVMGIKNDELGTLREDSRISRLMFLYHYNKNVRLKGEKPEEYEIDEWYVKLMEDIQKEYQKLIASLGIAIECNPSSNVLISSFNKYSEHPLMKFNQNHMQLDRNDPDLFVSINTDDIGVFDTSLENEYALLFAAIRDERHKQGKLSDEPIYGYLNYIRELGFEMAFCKKTKDI